MSHCQYIGFSDIYPTYADFLKEKAIIVGILHGTLPEREADLYLRKKNVDYVYDETGGGGETLYPKLLDVVYTNPHFKIYKVKGKPLDAVFL